MKDIYQIGLEPLTLTGIHEIILNNKSLVLSKSAKSKVEQCRTYLNEKLTENKRPIYGINTGFGALHNVAISNNNLTILQENLVMSHACGTGETVAPEIIKIMLLLKIQGLSFGHSGVQLSTLNRLIEFYNNEIIPVVYTQGSLGASGDLAPLAHLALPLIGKGEVLYQGKVYTGEQINKKFLWTKIALQSKEGLALLNGTQFMSAYAVNILLKSFKLSYMADVIAALSLDAFNGSLEPFDDLLHLVRPHNGQIKTAKRIKEFLEGSEIVNEIKLHVQDPYSFRCIPQVHGASLDVLNFVKKTVETEINSVTDNPIIFIENNKILSGGNFHGQPLALALDFLAISLSELGSISERRVFQLVSGLRGLPAFLVSNPGLNSGLMIPQYTAASIVSQNKQLATPASVDSIVSSNGQEDHVSMGANAATKAKRVVDNLETILAIELLNAAQAITFRSPLKTSEFLESLLKIYRQEVPFVKEDRVLQIDIKNSLNFLQNISVEPDELFN